jgi:hypothetical protein
MVPGPANAAFRVSKPGWPARTTKHRALLVLKVKFDADNQRKINFRCWSSVGFAVDNRAP